MTPYDFLNGYAGNTLPVINKMQLNLLWEEIKETKPDCRFILCNHNSGLYSIYFKDSKKYLLFGIEEYINPDFTKGGRSE